MNTDPQVALPELLTGFRQEFTEAVALSSQRFRQDLQALQTTLEKQLDQRLSTVEKALSGPLSHSLPWDWIPEDALYVDVDSFLDNRKLRYRGDPCYIVTAREYYAKYCAAQVDVLKELQAHGHFYTPPQSRLFLKFGREVVEGKKRLFHESEIRRCGVPQDQIDLAWSAEGPGIVSDFSAYLPLNTPITRPEKEYYLDVVHTVRGIKYQPVLPISEQETEEMESFRGKLQGLYALLQRTDEEKARLAGASVELSSLRQASCSEWTLDAEEIAHCREQTIESIKALRLELAGMQTEVEAKRKIEENMRKQESETNREMSKMMETDYNEAVFDDIQADSQ